jgi:hypothetical protein
MDRAVPLYQRNQIQIILILRKNVIFYALGALWRNKIRKDASGIVIRIKGPIWIKLQVLDLNWIFSAFNFIHVKDYFIYSPE